MYCKIFHRHTCSHLGTRVCSGRLAARSLPWAPVGFLLAPEAAPCALPPPPTGRTVPVGTVTFCTILLAQQGRGSDGKAVLTQKEIAKMMIWRLCFI